MPTDTPPRPPESQGARPLDLEEARRHFERIVANRLEDGGPCPNGSAICDCSEHEARRGIAALDALRQRLAAMQTDRDHYRQLVTVHDSESNALVGRLRQRIAAVEGALGSCRGWIQGRIDRGLATADYAQATELVDRADAALERLAAP